MIDFVPKVNVLSTYTDTITSQICASIWWKMMKSMRLMLTTTCWSNMRSKYDEPNVISLHQIRSNCLPTRQTSVIPLNLCQILFLALFRASSILRYRFVHRLLLVVFLWVCFRWICSKHSNVMYGMNRTMYLFYWWLSSTNIVQRPHTRTHIHSANRTRLL